MNLPGIAPNYVSRACLFLANHVPPIMQWKMQFCHAADHLAFHY
jgi:hypothetical protein